MKYLLVAVLLSTLLMPLPLFAADFLDKDLVVLNEETVLKRTKTSEGLESLQLYKIVGDQIVLKDAIQVQEKIVNFKPLLEFVRLKIEEKSTF